jgi:hypothetical protein
MSFDDILRNLARLRQQSLIAMRAGMEQGADIIEADMHATTAYVGMSGATRASTIAYVATADDPNDSEPQSAHNTAAGLLSGFVGHNGQPLLESAPGPGTAQMMIVATVPTDYIIKLETERAGQKAFVGDTLTADAPQAFEAVVRALQQEWS